MSTSKKAYLVLSPMAALALMALTVTASASAGSTREFLPLTVEELILTPSSVCEPVKGSDDSTKACSGDGTKAFCHYCDLDLCGCIWIPNCTLVFECSCSELGCFRQCKNVNCIN